nr:MAG TPA: hypothetical protein [Caudoviricetes sp.]
MQDPSPFVGFRRPSSSIKTDLSFHTFFTRVSNTNVFFTILLLVLANIEVIYGFLLSASSTNLPASFESFFNIFTQLLFPFRVPLGTLRYKTSR